MSDKPRIFIASSTEYVKYAHAVHMFLNNKYAHTKLWEVTMEPGDYALPALYKTFHEYDFGIFIFSPDDVLELRDKFYKTTRDNVIFEFGLFLGVNGLDRAFILTPSDYLSTGRIPSDLFGITIATFDGQRKEEELIDALSSSCLIIMKKIERITTAKAQKIPMDTSVFGILEYEGDMLSKLVDMLKSARKYVTFVITSNERLIVFDLITSIVYAKLNNIQIDIHYYPLVDTHEISFCVELFKQLGCNVIQYPTGIAPENVAFFSDADTLDYSVLIIKTKRFARKNVFAFFYKGPIHSSTINSFVKNITPISKTDSFKPELLRVSEEEILNKFKTVPLYAQNKCTFSLAQIKPKDTLPKSFNLIKEYKLKQILLLNLIFSENKFNLYEPVAIKLKNGQKHYFVPPVVENQKGALFIIEGHTRFFNHLQSNIPITCVLVKGMEVPLPTEPTKWDRIKVASYSVPQEFIPSAGYLERFRKIETYLHKPDWFPETTKMI